jgi:signal transduction histidine kinase
MRRPLPLHIRLALGYTGFFALVLITLSVSVLVVVRQTLLSELEHHLQSSADLINSDFDISNSPLTTFFNDPEFLLRALPPSVAGLEAPGLYAEAVAADGRVVATSASLEGQVIALASADRALALAGQTRLTTGNVGSAPAMLIVHPLVDDNVVRGVLVIARSLTEVDHTLGLVAASLGVVGVIALLTAMWGGSLLAAQALRPVAEVARTAEQIVQASDLARRVPPAPEDNALGHLTRTINDLLARLERLFTSQQRFVADVSHELRTPLAAMRSTVEVLRRGAARDPQMLDDSLAGLERETQRLGRLASDLLLLAHADLGVRLARLPVSLDELLLEIVRELRPLAAEVRLIPDISEQVAVLGDRDRLKQALLNLVVNAIQHTSTGDQVRVALARSGESAILSVCDTGAGIAEADLPFIFDRFYRADPARARVSGGAGLGLAIVRWVAESHSGSVTVTSAPGQGSRFCITIPAIPSDVVPLCEA